MTLENQSLVLDLVEWVAREPRSYTEVMEAWRTSCPRLSIWEDALDRGYLLRENGQGGDAMVKVTAAGEAFLKRERRVG